MRRVLLITYEFPPFRGGIGRVAEGLAEGALACGLAPTVFAPDYGAEQTSVDATRPYLVERFEGAFCSIVSPRRLLRFAWLTRNAISRHRPDVVHGVDPPAQMALTALSRAGLRSRYLLTVHGTELLRYATEPLPRMWMRNGLARADAVCAVSAHVLARLVRDFPRCADRAFVSHPGIAPAWHDAPPTGRDTVRRSWGARGDDTVLLTVARVVPEKGQDRVIAALSRLPAAVKAGLVYVLAGTGPEDFARALDDGANAAGIRLVRTGALSDADLLRVYDGADLFAMLSRRTPKRLEGLGLTYIEAGARGLPSLACDTGGVAEAVRDGVTGRLLPERATADETAAALAELLGDAALRRRLGRQAQEYAHGFTYERHAREVYGRLGLLD